MKLFWALHFCGITFCLAKSSCSNQDLMLCFNDMGEGRTITDPETEEDLEKYCRAIECVLERYNKCCKTKEDKAMFDQHEIIYGSLCFKKNALRKKYLDNIKCLNKAITSMGSQCSINTVGLDHDTFCFEKLPEAIKCSNNLVNQTCNEDALEVYERVYPGSWFYGCEQEKELCY